MKTRYIDNTKLAQSMGLQPGEDYGEAEECHTHLKVLTHKGRKFEIYFDEMAGPFTQWKAFCLGIGQRSGLDRDEVIAEMLSAIDKAP